AGDASPGSPQDRADNTSGFTEPTRFFSITATCPPGALGWGRARAPRRSPAGRGATTGGVPRARPCEARGLVVVLGDRVRSSDLGLREARGRAAWLDDQHRLRRGPEDRARGPLRGTRP